MSGTTGPNHCGSGPLTTRLLVPCGPRPVRSLPRPRKGIAKSGSHGAAWAAPVWNATAASTATLPGADPPLGVAVGLVAHRPARSPPAQGVPERRL